MGSPIIIAAEAIKDMLNAGTFTESFTATREYILYQRLQEISDLTVWVVPAERDTELESRTKDKNTYTISITVMNKCGTNEQIDALQDLAEEIYLHFRRGELTSLENYKLTGFESPTLYSPDELATANLYVSEISILITNIY